jgi:hypothetical protein
MRSDEDAARVSDGGQKAGVGNRKMLGREIVAELDGFL